MNSWTYLSNISRYSSLFTSTIRFLRARFSAHRNWFFIGARGRRIWALPIVAREACSSARYGFLLPVFHFAYLGKRAPNWRSSFSGWFIRASSYFVTPNSRFAIGRWSFSMGNRFAFRFAGRLPSRRRDGAVSRLSRLRQLRGVCSRGGGGLERSARSLGEQSSSVSCCFHFAICGLAGGGILQEFCLCWFFLARLLFVAIVRCQCRWVCSHTEILRLLLNLHPFFMGGVCACRFR